MSIQRKMPQYREVTQKPDMKRNHSKRKNGLIFFERVKYMKKAISWFIILVMLISLVPAGLFSVSAASPAPTTTWSTEAWDFSQQDAGIIKSTAGGEQRLVFGEVASSSYVIEANIKLETPTDVWPLAGFIVGDDLAGSGLRLEIFTGWQGNADIHWFKITDQNRGLIEEIQFEGRSGLESETGAKVKVIRDGKKMSFYLNDKLIHTGEYDKLSNPGVPGLVACDSLSTFSDVKLIQGGSEAAPEVTWSSDYWDFSQKDYGIIRKVGGGVENLIFCGDNKMTDYSIEANIRVDSVTADWPMGGFIVGDDLAGKGIRLAIFTGWQGNADVHWFKIMDQNFGLIEEIQLTGKSGLESADGAKVKVVRTGQEMKFYINGQLIHTGVYENLANAGTCGLMAGDGNVTFSNIKLTQVTADPAPTTTWSTDGWDFSQQNVGTIKSTAGGDQRLVFGSVSSSNYLIEANIKVNSVTADWPLAGFIVGDDLVGSGLRLEIYTGWQGNAEQHWFKITDANRVLIEEVVLSGKSGLESANGANVKVLRAGKKMTLFINDQQIYSKEFDLLANPGVAGLITCDSLSTFSNVKVTQITGDPAPTTTWSTDGWDFSQQNVGIIQSTAGGDQRLVFGEKSMSNYVIEANIKLHSHTADWPLAGFIVGDDLVGSGLRLEIYTGWQGNADVHWFKITDQNRGLIEEVQFNGRSGLDSEDGARVKVVRAGKKMSFYLNDQLIYSREFDNLANPGVPGLITCDSLSTFSDVAVYEIGEPAPEVTWHSDYWDFSQSDYGIIRKDGGGTENLIFRGNDKRMYYSIEANIRMDSVTGNWPMAGFIVGDDLLGKGIRLAIFTGWQGNADNHWFKIMDQNFNLIEEIQLTGKSGLESAEGAKVRIERAGKEMKFYINGQLIHTGVYENLANVGACGLMAGEANVTFSDIVYTEPAEDPLKFDSATSVLNPGWNLFNYYSNGVMMPFQIYIPEGYSADKNYPALMLLHGLGLNGQNPNAVINSNEGVPVRRALEEYKDTILIVPVAGAGWITLNDDPNNAVFPNGSLDYANGITESAWLQAADALYAELTENLGIDENRLYLSGYSRGGQATLYMLNKYPERFAGAIVMVATGDVNAAATLAKTPVWIFANTNDNAMVYDEVVKLVEAVKAAGGEIKLTTGDTVHDAGPWTTAEATLIEWLYSQTTEETSNPSTADATNVYALAVMMVASLAAVCCLMIAGKRRMITK